MEVVVLLLAIVCFPVLVAIAGFLLTLLCALVEPFIGLIIALVEALFK